MLTLLAACLGGRGGDDGSSDDTGDPPPPAPAIEITWPDADEGLCPYFAVAVDITGFTLVNPEDEPPNVDGEGHWHLHIAEEAAPEAEASEAWEDEAIYTNRALPDGDYEVYAVLVQNDHGALPSDWGGTHSDTATASVTEAGDCTDGP